MRNPAYAHFLDEIAAGLSALPAEGPLHAGDLAAYTVYEREPLTVDLPGGTLFTNPPPSLGGRSSRTRCRPPGATDGLDLLEALRDATDHNKTLAPTSVRGPRTSASPTACRPWR